jgi:hypothetical protein
MSLNHPDIPRLNTIDLRSDETRIFYAIEGQYRDELPFVDLYTYEDTRDSAASSLAEKKDPGWKVVIYNVIAPWNMEEDNANDMVCQMREIG